MKQYVALLLLICLFVISEQHDLKKVILITRHGDRTPMRNYPNTYKWEDPGQLTGEGMNQLYKLGKRMRQEYIVEKQLLPSTYNRSLLYARSTDKDRTLMSAQSFLMGLYPAGTGPMTADNSEEWYSDLYPGYHNDFNGLEDGLPDRQQSIPVHTVLKKHDLLLHQYKNCPKLSEMRKELKNSDEWKKKEKDSATLLKKIAEIIGVESLKLKEIGSAYHSIKADIVHKKNHHDLPYELKKELIEVKDWVMKRKFYNREMGRLGAGMLLNHISKEMNGESEYSSDPKFIYYSAHDGTLLALLAALGAEDFPVPHYASYILFEMHENSEGKHIEVKYTGDPLMSECSPKCEYNTFKSLVLDGMTDFEYFASQCDYRLSEETPSETSNWWTLFPLICFIAGVVLTFTFTKNGVKDKRN